MNVQDVRIMIMVAEFERSLRFYHETLEQKDLLQTWDLPNGGKGALMKVREGVILELLGPSGGEVYGGPTPVAISIGLRLESPQEVDRWYERLSTSGVQVVDKPSDKPWGERSFAVNDPDGNVLHLYARLQHVA